jgi:hypothetical protein
LAAYFEFLLCPSKPILCRLGGLLREDELVRKMVIGQLHLLGYLLPHRHQRQL